MTPGDRTPRVPHRLSDSRLSPGRGKPNQAGLAMIPRGWFDWAPLTFVASLANIWGPSEATRIRLKPNTHHAGQEALGRNLIASADAGARPHLMSEIPTPPPTASLPTPRSLTFDVLLTLGTKIASLLLTVGTGVVLARALGPSGRGAVAVAFAFALLLLQLGTLGLHSANAYFAAREPGQTARILTNTLWSAAAMGLALVAAGLLLRELFPGVLRGLDSLEVAVVLISVPAVLAIPLLQGILLAEGRMAAYNGIELAVALATFLGFALVLLVFSGGVLTALVLFTSVNIAGAVGLVYLLKHHLLNVRQFDARLFQSMLRYGFRIYLSALFVYLTWRANLLLVNGYLGSAQAGRFSIALGLGDPIHLLPTVVALNLFPRIARGDASSDTGAVFRSLALVYGALCVAIIPLIGPIIRLLYGGAFSGAINISYWLLPGIYAYGMVSVLSYHFAGHGYPLRALFTWVVGVVVNFGIAFPLLARHQGTEYAAIAISAAYTVVLALHVHMFAAESGGYAALVPRPRETARLLGEMAKALTTRRLHRT
jgi:O-antigen/teichoic acid export membrane protein